MTDALLEKMLMKAATQERRITRRLLHLIRDAEERKLYAKRGYPSLHAWLVERFKYSDSAAHRRIQAARLLRAVPAMDSKILNGDVNLTTMAMAQSAIRRQEKAQGFGLTAEEKSEVAEAIQGKGARDAERVLLKLLPEGGRTGLPPELLADLDRVREVISHILPGASFAEVVQYLATYFLNSAAVKRRGEESCEYEDPETGKVCGSRYQLETDHIVPKALGGTDDPINLRKLCRTHNLLAAEETLGFRKANEWQLARFANAQERRFRKQALTYFYSAAVDDS